MEASSSKRHCKGRSKLAEQLSELSNPKPASFHPDQEDLEDETAAKICEFSYQPVVQQSGALPRMPSRIPDFEEAKYSGKVVSRKELEAEGEDELDSDEFESSDYSEEEDEDLAERASQDEGERDDQSEISEDHADYNTIATEEEEEEEEGRSDEEEGEGEEMSDEEMVTEEGEGEGREVEEGGGVQTLSMESLKNEMEKGKAAKEQIRFLDGLVEMRIKLHGVLSLSNRLPSPHLMPQFLEKGGLSLKDSLNETHRNAQQLLSSLLDLQEELQQHITEGDNETNEEDIASTDEDEDEIQEGEETSMMKAKSRKRKKRCSDGAVLTGKTEDYEVEVERLYSALRPYRDGVITKWNEKTRLASGKITSKAYMQVDRSILSQIEHVMTDKERLKKRTQLRRSVYHILGEGGEEKGDDDHTPAERDAHLRDYNEDVFDDDDFYHQLLKELIERKTSYSDSSDPIEMGRQWLDLQKLRQKAKKKVDTKASKGRKIRYNVHPKLVNFMAPVDHVIFSDSSKNDLFSSLFGGRYTSSHRP